MIIKYLWTKSSREGKNLFFFKSRRKKKYLNPPGEAAILNFGFSQIMSLFTVQMKQTYGPFL